jgi:hypothetical protein
MFSGIRRKQVATRPHGGGNDPLTTSALSLAGPHGSFIRSSIHDPKHCKSVHRAYQDLLSKSGDYPGAEQLSSREDFLVYHGVCTNATSNFPEPFIFYEVAFPGGSTGANRAKTWF